MATAKLKKAGPKDSELFAQPGKKVIQVDLSAFAHEHMNRYGISVNEDRSLGEVHDGFKPVQRRVLYAAYEGGFRSNRPVEKSARLVGNTLGKFHPHGDTACYGAVVNMVNSRYPLLEGAGNFGDFFDPDGFAAMRYTNVRLSVFSERVFFDPFYLPVCRYVPNYDGKEKEPTFLLSLLPNVLFNTTFGIGYGLSARIPRFTMESVGALLKLGFEGTEITPALCASTLVFTTQYGGKLAAGQKAAVNAFMKEGKGRLLLESQYVYDANQKALVFSGFAPFSNFEARAEAVSKMAGVLSVADTSNPKTKAGEFTVFLRKTVDAKNLPQIARPIVAKFSQAESYMMNLTQRRTKDNKADVRLRSMTVPQLVTEWIKYRLALEAKACEYQIGIKVKEIRKLEVMRLAVANRSAIIKALDKKLDDEALNAYLAKLLKVTVEEAAMILELRVRQLKSLEDDKLRAELKRLKELKAEYEGRKAKPGPYCQKHVMTMIEELK